MIRFVFAAAAFSDKIATMLFLTFPTLVVVVVVVVVVTNVHHIVTAILLMIYFLSLFLLDLIRL
jgi:hypothetical protein